MTPGARLAAAIEVLDDVEARHRPVADALKGWGLAHRFAGSGDRAVIGNIVYDALRWRSSSAYVMNSEAPRALVLATVARRWGLGVEGVTAMLAGDAHAPPVQARRKRNISRPLTLRRRPITSAPTFRNGSRHNLRACSAKVGSLRVKGWRCGRRSTCASTA
jgi:hypothetical protein